MEDGNFGEFDKYSPDMEREVANAAAISSRFRDRMERIRADMPFEQWQALPPELKSLAVIAADAEAGEVCRRFGITAEEWNGYTQKEKHAWRAHFRETSEGGSES